jgi:FG-GAP repeat
VRTRLFLVVLLSLGPAAARAGTIVIGLGSGGAPQVGVFDSGTATRLSSFLAYGAPFTGGVRVAAGDVNGDGVTDIVTGAGPGGGSHIKVFDGATGTVLLSFFAFDPSFSGGVFVAAGDVNSDGKADIVAGADAGGASHVKPATCTVRSPDPGASESAPGARLRRALWVVVAAPARGGLVR